MTPKIPYPKVPVPAVPVSGGMMEAHEIGLILWAASSISPASIIEFGTNWGSTASMLASIPGSSVFTVDIAHADRVLCGEHQRGETLLDRQLGMFCSSRKNVRQLIVRPGSCIDLHPAISFQFALIDGDHRYNGVRMDTEQAICRSYTSKNRPLLICWHDYKPCDESWIGVGKYVDQLASVAQVRHVEGTRLAFCLIEFSPSDACGPIRHAFKMNQCPPPSLIELLGVGGLEHIQFPGES